MTDTQEAAPPTPPPQEEEGVVEGDTGPIDVADFFSEVNDDMSEVIWGHGVNSLAKLEEVIADPKIMMIEVDILLGHLEVSQEEGEVKEVTPAPPPTPIMAHPPMTSSDLTFPMWLDKVITANQEGKKKGIKLDFKELDAVKECLDTLNARKDKISFPVWLNADILSGPGDQPPPIPADDFLTTCTHYPQAVLSLGWSTRVSPSGGSVDVCGYRRVDMEGMVGVLESHAIRQPVTFPIRAALIPNSIDHLEWILDEVTDSTLTIWSSESDPFDPMAIVTLRDLLGPEAVYLDLPPSHMTQYQEAMAAVTSSGATGEEVRSFLPNTASLLATLGVGLASALAALYLYE